MEPKDCFIGFFDIIGFKNLRSLSGTDGLYKLFKNGFVPSIQHAAAGKSKAVGNVFLPDFNEDSLNFKIISDSIILYTKDTQLISLIRLINASVQIMGYGFGGTKAPLRGALGYGDLIDDPNGTYIGSAVENAYQYESCQAWAGCILTPELEQFCKERNYIELYRDSYQQAIEQAATSQDIERLQKHLNILKKYNVPMQINPKDKAVEYYNQPLYTLNWTSFLFENAAERSFHPPTSQHAETIIKNTVAYEKWARSS